MRGQDTCKGTVCDPYTLTVDGGRELRIVVDTPTAENVSLDVVDPDGSHYMLNTADLFTQRTFIGEAIAGTWTIRTYGTGDFDTFDYELTSEVNLADEPDFVPPSDGSDATG